MASPAVEMHDRAETKRFSTLEGVIVPSLTAQQMKIVDDLAENQFHLGVLQMMENAGRSLAQMVWSQIDGYQAQVAILAGPGGNGGGGLAAARHLHNRGLTIDLILSREEAELRGPAKAQWEVLKSAGLAVLPDSKLEEAVSGAQVVVDALIGYGLQGSPRGRTRRLIELCNQRAGFVISLDIPSGLDSTSGQTPGVCILPRQILTLALPKTGLLGAPGDLFLADIGIPPQLYQHLDIDVPELFKGEYIIPIKRITQTNRGKLDSKE